MKFIYLMMLLISIANARELEFNLNYGDYCFFGLRDPNNPSSIIPLQKFVFLNKNFERRNLQIKVELNFDEKDVVTTIWVDNVKKYDITNRYSVSSYGRNFPFGSDFVLGGVRLFRAEDFLMIHQNFSSRKTKKEYEFIAIASKNREHLIKQLKISEGFVNWNWVFKDPTEYFNPFIDRFDLDNQRATAPSRN